MSDVQIFSIGAMVKTYAELLEMPLHTVNREFVIAAIHTKAIDEIVKYIEQYFYVQPDRKTAYHAYVQSAAAFASGQTSNINLHKFKADDAPFSIFYTPVGANAFALISTVHSSRQLVQYMPPLSDEPAECIINGHYSSMLEVLVSADNQKIDMSSMQSVLAAIIFSSDKKFTSAITPLCGSTELREVAWAVRNDTDTLRFMHGFTDKLSVVATEVTVLENNRYMAVMRVSAKQQELK